MNIKKIAVSAAPAILLLGIAAFAFAQTGNETAPTGPTTLVDLVTTINRVIDVLFVALIIASVIFIILAAFQFITAGGDPNGVIMARQKLIWAAVGIIVALLARAIPAVITNLISSGGGGGGGIPGQ